MNYEVLLKNVEEHVTVFFIEHKNPKLFYHDIAHTKAVVEAAVKIAGHYKLDEHERFVLYTAAWFHDTGYLVNTEEHEVQSAILAEGYLKKLDVQEADIEAVKKCIMATKMPQAPSILLEEIICDADLFYLGTDNYKNLNKLLRKEINALHNDIGPDSFEWRLERIRFFEAHRYHTDYCRLLLDKKKGENLAGLKSKQVRLIVDELDEPMPENEELLQKQKKQKKSKKNRRPVRGIETMFRISAANSVRVSVMADNKAHIMISVNSIIISVVLAFMVRSIDEYIHLLIPTLMLVAVNIVTITYAVLATRPKISNGIFTEKQVANKSVNLLYFGSFYRMNFPEYQVAVNKMMKDAEFLYGSLTKDIFWQGKVLGRKYRLLRISYNIFMYGMIATVLAFIIAFYLNGR